MPSGTCVLSSASDLGLPNGTTPHRLGGRSGRRPLNRISGVPPDLEEPMPSRPTRPVSLGIILFAAVALLATPLSALASARPVGPSTAVTPAIAGDTVLFSDSFERTTLGSGDGWTVTTGGSGSARLSVSGVHP